MNPQLYVYGLVRAGQAPAVAAPAVEAPGDCVRVIDAGPMAALVSDIGAGEVFSTRRNLLAHAKVLEEAMAQVTVLPARFGVIATGQAALARAVASQEARLAKLFDKVDGKAEYGVRVSWDRDVIMAEIGAEAPHLAERRAALAAEPEAATYYARIDLGREIAERISAKRSQEENRLFYLLRGCAEDSKLQAPEDDVQVLKADFLVSPQREAELFAAIERIEAERPGRLSVRYVGPAPTYNFVNIRLGLDGEPAAEAA